MRKCCVSGCHSNYGKPYVPTFLFPKDISRRRLWERNIGQSGIKISNNIGVCIKHFTEGSFFRYDSYENDSENHVRRKVKLKPDAAPTLFPGISHASLEENRDDSTRTLPVVPSAGVKDMNMAEVNDQEDDDNDIEVIEVRNSTSNSGSGYSSVTQHHQDTHNEILKDNEKIATKESAFSKRRSSSVGSNSSTGSTEIRPSATTPKRKKLERNPPTVTGRSNDCYCWVCHKEGITLCCMTCKRAYHQRCAGEMESPENWVCVECRKITAAENIDNRSTTLSEISLDKFCMLLKHCVVKLKSRSPAAFHQPVPVSYYSSYLDYVIHPMDLSLIEKNIKQKLYGCTEAFLADVKWIHHNSCVFNGAQHPLTLNARALVKTSELDMAEIEVCPDCYYHACTKGRYWFSDVCGKPHPIVWAKLKGFPYWPAKVVRILEDNVDARFFGAHDRAWVPVSQCYHLSKEMPTSSKPKKKGNYESALEELNIHVQHLKDKYGVFEYAPYRTPFDPTNKVFMYHGIDVDKVLVKDDVMKVDEYEIPSLSFNYLNNSFSQNGSSPYKLPSLLSDTSCDAKPSENQSECDAVSPGKVKRALTFEDPSPVSTSNASDSESTKAVKTFCAGSTNAVTIPTGVFEVSEELKMDVDDSLEHKITAVNPVSVNEPNAKVESDLEDLEKLQNSIDRVVKMYSGEDNKEKSTSGTENSILNVTLGDKETKKQERTPASAAEDQLPVVDTLVTSTALDAISDVTSALSVTTTTVVKKYDFFSQKLDQTIESIKLRVPNLETELPDESSEDEENSDDAGEGKDDTSDEDEESGSSSSESEDTDASSSEEESSDEDVNCDNNAKSSSKSPNATCVSDDSEKASEESNGVNENADKVDAKEKEVLTPDEEDSSESKSGGSKELNVQHESLVVEDISKGLEVEIHAEEAYKADKNETSVVECEMSDAKPTAVEAQSGKPVASEVENPTSILSKFNESVSESGVCIEASGDSHDLNAEEIELTTEASLEGKVLTNLSNSVKEKENISLSDDHKKSLEAHNNVNKSALSPMEGKIMETVCEHDTSVKETDSSKSSCISLEEKEVSEFSEINSCTAGSEKEDKGKLPSLRSFTSLSEKCKFPFLEGGKIEISDSGFTLVKNTKDLEVQNDVNHSDKNDKNLKINASEIEHSSEGNVVKESFYPRTEIEKRKMLCKGLTVEQPVQTKPETLESNARKKELIIELEEIVIMEDDEEPEVKHQSHEEAVNEKSNSVVKDSETSKEKETYELRKRPTPSQVIDVIDLSSSDSESESAAKESKDSSDVKNKEEPETLKLNNRDNELIDDLLIDLSSNSLLDDQKQSSKSENNSVCENNSPIATFANSFLRNAVNSFAAKDTQADSIKLNSVLPTENFQTGHTKLAITNVISCQESDTFETRHVGHASLNPVPIASGLKRMSSDNDDVIQDNKKLKVYEQPPLTLSGTNAYNANVINNDANSISSMKLDDSFVKNNSVTVSEGKLRSLLEGKSSGFQNCDQNSSANDESSRGGLINEKIVSNGQLQSNCQSESPSLIQLSTSSKPDIIPVLLDSKGVVCPHCSKIRENSALHYSKKYESEIAEYKAKIAKLDRDAKQLKELLHLLKCRSEKCEWYHPQEVSELKHNMNLTLMEMRRSLEADMKGTLERLKEKYEEEKLNAVNEAKGKQWCASCKEPSIFYCCWNTSYCSYFCQKQHWPQHRFSCTQTKSPPPLKSQQTAEYVKITKKSTTVETSEMSSTAADRRLLLVMKPQDEVQHPAVVSQMPVNMIPNALPFTVASKSMSNTVSTADSTTVNYSQAAASKIQYLTPKNHIQLVSASPMAAAQSSTPLSLLPNNHPVQIVLAPVKTLNEKVVTSALSGPRPVQDSSEIITKVRSRQTDLTTAIQLINKMNKETEETLKKKQLEENTTEELFISLPKSSIDLNYSDSAEASPNFTEQNSGVEEILVDDEPLVLPDDDEEEDSNDSSDSKMVSIGPEVEINEKKLKQCEKHGTTPTKLVRCLMTVFFSMQDLAKSSVFGRKSNVTKQTRPALSMKVVNAILGFVSQKFPGVQRTDLVLAMNLKCKEARKRSLESQDIPLSSNKKHLAIDVSDESFLKSKAITKTATTASAVSPNTILVSETSSNVSPKVPTSNVISSSVTVPCVLPQLSRALTTTIRNVIPTKAVQLIPTTKTVTLSSSASRIVTIPRSLQCTKNMKQQISIKPKPTIITAERGPGGLLQIPSSILQVSPGVSVGKSVFTSAKPLASSGTAPVMYTVKNASKMDVTSYVGEHAQAIQSSVQSGSETGQRPIVVLEVPPSAQQDTSDIHSQEKDEADHVVMLS